MTNRHNYAVNCSLIFTELPVNERAQAAADAGFSAVEFWWPFASAVPSASELDAFASSIEDAGVSLIGLNFFAGDMPGGDRGIVSWPSRGGEFQDNVGVVVELAKRLGTKAFNALYGNREDGLDPQVQDDFATEQLVFAAKNLNAIGGRILVEPLSGAAQYPLLFADDVAQVIDRVRTSGNLANVDLLCDVYHLAVNGDDVAAAITKYADLIGHVQIADAPGRGEPGSGDLPIMDWISQLRSVGYEGLLALEYKPTGTSVDSFEWLGGDR